MFVDREDKKNTSQCNVVQHNTTFNNKKLNLINFVKVEFIAELLYWIALDCIGVPNKVATDCVQITKS